jgi:hypothetical protein
VLGEKTSSANTALALESLERPIRQSVGSVQNQGALRKAATRLSQPATWFQLANVRLTTFPKKNHNLILFSAN